MLLHKDKWGRDKCYPQWNFSIETGCSISTAHHIPDANQNDETRAEKHVSYFQFKRQTFFVLFLLFSPQRIRIRRKGKERNGKFPKNKTCRAYTYICIYLLRIHKYRYIYIWRLNKPTLLSSCSPISVYLLYTYKERREKTSLKYLVPKFHTQNMTYHHKKYSKEREKREEWE